MRAARVGASVRSDLEWRCGWRRWRSAVAFRTRTAASRRKQGYSAVDRGTSACNCAAISVSLLLLSDSCDDISVYISFRSKLIVLGSTKNLR